MAKNPPGSGETSGNRGASAARAADRVADGRAGCRPSMDYGSGRRFFLARIALVDACSPRRLDHRLAAESAARGHPRPSDAEPLLVNPIGSLAALPVAALFDLPVDASPPPSGRESDRSVRGSRELLLAPGGLVGPRPFRRVLARAQMTLLGRLVFGPAFMSRAASSVNCATLRDKPGARAGRLLAIWSNARLVYLGNRRLRNAVLGLCRGLRLSGHEPGDALFRRASRRGATYSSRTAIVENAGIFGLLFLNQQSARRLSPARRPAVVPDPHFLIA